MTLLYQIIVGPERLIVRVPYNPNFARVARRGLNGNWTGREWVFDPRNATAVRAAVKRVYGWEEGTAYVSVRITFLDDVSASRRSVSRLGRPLVWGSGRSAAARVCEGVVLEEGQIGSWGSQRNWSSLIKCGTVLLVHDVPLAMAQKEIKSTRHDREIYEVIGAPSSEADMLPANADALRREEISLHARLASIRQQLREHGADSAPPAAVA